MRPEDIEVCKVRLKHCKSALSDIPSKVREALAPACGALKPGAKIAIAVGSRGISNIAVIVKGVADTLKEFGTEPFIIPAMGSHGGATAEGQAQVLADYGVCEETMGVPVRSSMEVVSLGTTGGDPDIPVWMDRYAAKADGVIAVNRVKAHTDFHGEHESGIVKMLTIGLGKHAQAIAAHRYGANGLRDNIPRVSQKVIESGKIFGALAILEDGYDNTADLAFAQGMEIFALDRAFLERSKAMMAHLPFSRIDALVVDVMGKNYSGTGMDTNIIGRLLIRGMPDGAPECKRVAVLDLSEESHGNALGVGLADVTTERLRKKIDWRATYENVITSGFLERGFLPIVAEDDRRAVTIAVNSCGVHTGETIRFVRIKNTLHLDEIYVSRALYAEIADSPACERLSDFGRLSFSEDGMICAF